MNTYSEILLEDFGYDNYFKSAAKRLGLNEYLICRVIAEYKELYRVRGKKREYLAKIPGKQMFTAKKREDFPAVGDWLAIKELQQGKAIIIDILPRKNVLKKKYSNKQEDQVIATNIDTAFIVESVDKDFNLNRFERYLIIVREANIIPIFILNKIDLISETEINIKLNQIKNRFNDLEIILTSTKKDADIKDLISYIQKGKTYCFLGSSGVGKSTLINKLLVSDEIKTREISLSSGKGTHTTTTREIYLIQNGGIVIDNPGTREVGISDSSTGIETVFNEIVSISKMCRFSNCSHNQEPGCAIIAAIENNELDEEKFQNYKKMIKETNYFRMSELEKRKKDKKFGQYIKKNKKPTI